MPVIHSNQRIRLRLILLLLCVAAISLACAFPSLPGSDTPSPAALAPALTPTSPPEELPPALVESDPLPGSEIPLNSPITLRFNQPMNKASVEAAISVSGASGRFEWPSESTLTFLPDSPLLPGIELNVGISVTAQSQEGAPLHKPVALQYYAAGALSLAQMLPENGQRDVDPASAIVAAFNRPVVPLGSDAESTPKAFDLEPAASGRGEWINTSTYIFYPEPPLSGGFEYTVLLNSNLASSAGAPLQNADIAWRFNVAPPRVMEVEPTKRVGVPLDAPIRVHFNQRMNPTSAESLSVRPAGQEPLSGTAAWDETFTTLTFTPSSLLQRSVTYELSLDASALSAGGIPIGKPFKVSWTTVSNFALVGSVPVYGATFEHWQWLELTFSAPLPESILESYFRLEPAAKIERIYHDQDSFKLELVGDLLPSTNYMLIIDPSFSDRYGQPLGVPASLAFRTAPLQPRLERSSYDEILFLTPQDNGLDVQITNLSEIPLTLDVVPLSDFFKFTGPDGYNQLQTYRTAGRTSWTARFDLPADRSTRVQLPLNQQNQTLPTGIYLLRTDFSSTYSYTNQYVLIVSNVHLTYKISARDILVWAVDIRSNQPVANAPFVIYSEDGEALVSSFTGEDGIYHGPLPPGMTLYETTAVVIGQPGEELFSAAIAGWNQGVEPYAFEIPADYDGPRQKTYLYTDRPIYRPGQTVYFRAITRFQDNGRYTLPPDFSNLPVQIIDGEATQLASYNLPLSAFGTTHSEYTLMSDARPGFYRVVSGSDTIYFQVAAYRKPEINLQVAFDHPQALVGDDLTASINARYFFDAPAGNVTLNWALYETPDHFTIPDYQTGMVDNSWVYGGRPYFPYYLGAQVAQGTAQTGPDGLFNLSLPNPTISEWLGQQTRLLTVEVTAYDESGLPVNARASIQVHPASFYIGIRPDTWTAQAGQQAGYSVQVVDWSKNPAGSQALQAVFSNVVYQRIDPPPGQLDNFPTYQPQYTEISSADFVTGPDGMARLAFTAPEPGTYQLEVRGDGAQTQILLWFGGPGQTVWPNLPNQRLRLTPDRLTYQPGDTARIFVPNPFPDAAPALLTVERSIIMRHQVVIIPQGGSTIDVPLSGDDAPNIYISLTLLGKNELGRVDFRQGYTSLEVAPRSLLLNVELTRQPERALPGSEVVLNLRVTDAQGDPVQGEFSLAVVDTAVLALAEPNSPQIAPAFYGQQPLGVSTNLSLASYGNRLAFIEGGIGGGGGGEFFSPTLREDFPDTAYWNAVVVTNDTGETSVSIALPDSLTTWQVDVRGLSVDARVGSAQTEFVTTKEVLVRPVTPRFLVVGDHVKLAAIVQNNTPTDLNVQVSLESLGFTLDSGQNAAQQAVAPAGGRVRVEWWGFALDVPAVDLVFSVQAGEYQDAARPPLGSLPVLRYAARQTFATAGLLEGAVQELELVSLPSGVLHEAGSVGELKLELAPSLAAAMLTSLDALELYEYECTEQVLARFLPNLFLHQALKVFNISLPEVEKRLQRTLQPGVARLVARQNMDGGWGWWPGAGGSSPYITSYVLFGLSQAQAAGVSLPEDVIERAVDYLMTAQRDPALVDLPYQLDRLAFQQFALAQAGSPDQANALALYQEKDQLSPWALALLALALESAAPGGQEAADLLARLQTTAQRSATGAFWSDPFPRSQNLNTTVTTTAMVVYALAQKDPASILLPDAIRFIVSSRGAEGSWQSTYETTWALLAATAFMQGTGEVGGVYDFRATLNSVPLASGQAGGDTLLTPVVASVPVSSLHPDYPNALRIERSAGPGRLYYTALLDVAFPADQAAPFSRGFSVERVYYDPENCTRASCPAIQAAPPGAPLTVRLTIVVPQEAYYVVVEDYIPAGSEILDRSLKTSQLGYPGYEEPSIEPRYDPADPFAEGWGWWLFSQPTIFDSHIAWSADYLPPGTYELVYTLTPLQAGEFRLLPARAYQFYFPEVQGSSAGGVFTITP
jgi:alpha-2-macroglobulin